MQKAPDSDADVLVFDLEDAVAPEDRPHAREAVRSLFESPDFAPDAEVCVRINPPGVAADDDLAAILGPSWPDAIMIPKTSGPSEVETATRLMAEHGKTRPIFALIETAAGVLEAPAIAAKEQTTALVFGAEDLAADLGAARSESGEEVAYARQRVVIAAAAADVDAIDTVYTNFEDLEGLRTAAAQAADLGFDGKLAIHPDQVSPIHAGIRPDEERLAWAHRVISAAAEHDGVFQLEGEMIDAPLIERARRLIERAGESPVDQS